MSRPLGGLLVLDCAQFLAGPIAALRLADLGARVVKVEPPTGEVGRKLYLSELAVAGESALFQTINRGKEGIAVDLKDPGDRARVERLIAEADVAIMNFRPGVAERLGLDWATLSARHPRLVHASLTGYGPVSSNITFITETGKYGKLSAHQSFALAGVPEPATWAMMIAGFGAVGGAMRRRAARPVLA